jgi:hypothetical protein
LSGILWIYAAFKTTGNSEKKQGWIMTSVIIRSERLEFPSWMTVQMHFPVVAIYIYLSSHLFWMRQKSCWIDSMANVFNLFWPMVLHVNVYPFKLGKETLKPKLHTLPTEQQASDCFATRAVSHWFLPKHSLLNLQFTTCVMLVSNWPMSTDKFYL